MNLNGWLIYTEEDAERNYSFITQLIKEANEQQINLKLILQHEWETLIHNQQVDFVWNRTRDFTVSQFFDEKQIRVFNRSLVNKIANNKYSTYFFAKELGIACIPSWTFSELPKDLQFPCVIKSASGHGGQEVALCNSYGELTEYSKRFGIDSVIQPFIHSNNQDIRVWVLGDKILGAVVRTGKDSFKSNYSLGGTIERFQLPPQLVNTVQTIIRHLNSDYIGIDFLPTIDGQYYLNELEDPVGARSFYQLYNTDLCEALITYIHDSLKQ